MRSKYFNLGFNLMPAFFVAWTRPTPMQAP
jgi:hypothetical protein